MLPEDDLFDFGDIEPFQPGEKVRFCGTRSFWFVDILASAERELRVDEVYTVKTVRAHSSWTEITLEETASSPYNSLWFERLLIEPSA